MIVQLALLLLGPARFKHEWKWLLTFGIILICLGGFIVLDAVDQTSYFVLDALGLLLFFAGTYEAIYSSMAPWNQSTPFKLSRAITLIVVGLIVVFNPVTMSHVDALLLGTAFMVLGIFKLIFSLLTRYPYWKIVVLGGFFNIILGSLFFAEWKSDRYWIEPLLFGLMFVLMGIGAISHAIILRNSAFLAREKGEEIVALDYFLRYHVSPRYKPAFNRLPKPDELAVRIEKKSDSNAPSELLLHIWLPTECAENYIPPGSKIPILSRYLLVKDKKGCVVVGHSAMQIKPDLYFSHTDKKWYQKIKNFEEDSPESFRFFEEMKAHDQEGVFFESYEEESKYWMPATKTIKMLKFNEDYLRLFENFYKMDSTYNLSVRNCSVCIAMGLDIGLLGCLAGKHMILRFIRLIFDKDLWLASFIRKRSEEMAWSPGLLCDYAIAMNRLIERYSGRIKGA